MGDATLGLQGKLIQLSQVWISQGLPSHPDLESTADDLVLWKQVHQVNGLWAVRPLMLTATIDDGLGQGLQIIQRYADVLGMDVIFLGLLQKPEDIVAACHRHEPDFLGLTVLQLDSDEDLCRIGRSLCSKTALIAGGPVFKFDPELAERCNVAYVAGNVACFIDYVLKWAPHP